VRSTDVVTLSPDALAGLFGGDLGDVFCLVASPAARGVIELRSTPGVEIRELAWEGPESRDALLATIAAVRAAGRRASVLWIADDEFEHYQPEELEAAKLVAISSFSAPLSSRALARSVEIVTTGDYEGELRIENRFMDLLDEAEEIRLACPDFGTTARFRHQVADHWFSLHGPLDWGQQTVLPTGEMSALVNASGEFVEEDSFAIDGRVVLRGQPVVHRGGPGVSLGATGELYDRLSAMADQPAVLELSNGFITGVSAPDGGTNQLVDGLRSLFDQDGRYAKIHEIGFGTNAACDPLVADNFFANERFPGVHLGIGLGGHTEFHIDLVTDAIEVIMVMPDGEEVDLYRDLGLRT
jgi:hypothetical protein